MQKLSAAEVIGLLKLQPHPEGGHFRETFRDAQTGETGRAASTAIYYLLARGERSHWHRVDAAEGWHWYAGAPLKLGVTEGNSAAQWITLGADIAKGESPQFIVPPHAWQSAESLGDWTLVGCTVAPAFEFSKFELAPIGWNPG